MKYTQTIYFSWGGGELPSEFPLVYLSEIGYDEEHCEHVELRRIGLFANGKIVLADRNAGKNVESLSEGWYPYEGLRLELNNVDFASETEITAQIFEEFWGQKHQD